MDKNKSLILLTGGAGFVGSYVLRELVERGHRVRALRRASSSMDWVRDVETRVEWVEGDVTDIVALEDAFAGVTHVCHCAGITSFHPRDALRLMQVNAEGTANMVNLALEHNIQKFVHVSSVAAIGRTRERPVLDEKSPWSDSKDNTRYAISKYLGEQEVWRGWAEGLPVAIVNPSIVLGAGHWDDGPPRFFKQVYEGLKFWPDGISNFVDARDVARFMALLLESDINGERYILSAEAMPTRTFFQLVAKHLQVPPPSIKVTPLLAEVAWRVEWLKEKLLGKPPVVTRESARASVLQYRYRNDKSLSVFNFQYRPLEETIRDTAEAFLRTR